MHRDDSGIFRAYEVGILKESPDNVLIGNKQYDHNDPSLTNYTGFFNTNGEYVMSKDTSGHAEFTYELKKGIRDGVITNVDNPSRVRVVGNFNTTPMFRIWTDLKVFSMWEGHDPRLAEVAVNILKELGMDPESFVYETGDDKHINYDDAMSYEEFVGQELTDDHFERESDNYRMKRENDRAMADYKLGNIPQKGSSFYRRGGD